MKRVFLLAVVSVPRSAMADPGIVAPVTDSAMGLGAVLASNGGWGIAGLFALVIWRLWKVSNDKDEKIFALLDKQNEVLKALEKLDGRKP